MENSKIIILDILKASFRGRPLLGKEMTVPKGYTG